MHARPYTAVALVAACACAAWCAAATAQESVGDLLAGALLDPEVGQWAWYNVTDRASSQKLVVRQAVVGRETIDKKTGYWVEFEIVPEVGYRLVYRMLLTGPASDPRNVHRIIRKEGADPAQAVPVPTQEAAPSPDPAPERRESLGRETVMTLDGPVQAEHFAVERGGRTVELWVNEDIKPTGIVGVRSDQGEMRLRNYGVGGRHAQSAITEFPVPGGLPQPQPEPEPRGRVDAGEEKPK